MPKRVVSERVREYRRKWHASNREKCRGYSIAWRKKNPEFVRAITREQTRRWYMKSKYNLTRDAYDAMLTAQGNACAICFTPDPGAKRDWRIDHVHGTKKIRGLLCHNCNVAIGHVKENTDVLKRMITYLGGNDAH